VALLLFVALVVAACGGSLVRYDQVQRQRGWSWLGWAIIAIWDGSIAYVLARYALAASGGG